jgi:hypothetical protein
MYANRLSGPAAHTLLTQTIAAHHELELERDIFEAVYRKRYKRAYAYYDQHHTIGQGVIAHCNDILSKHQLRSS